MSSKNASTNRWRDKYLNLIEDHEKLKKSSDEKQDQMRRALVMVSLLAEGQADSIDAPLAKLREAIKPQNNGRGLELTLQTLQKEVNRFEQQRETQANVLLDELSNAARQLLKMDLPADTRKRVKKVQKDAKDQLNQWSGYGEQLKAWSRIIGSLGYEQDQTAEEPEEKGGFFARLFQNKDKEALSQENPDVEPVGDDDATPEPENIQREPGFAQIEADVSASLSALLKQLVIPERFRARLDALRARLTSKLNWYELVPLFEDVAELVIDALGIGQQEFEQFLQSLDQRLETIQQLVNAASQGQLDRQKARKAFEEMVQGQVAEIRSVVNSKNDLGELGQSITSHLGLIVQAMEAYRSEEGHREAELTRQLADMQRKLDEMEDLAKNAQLAIEEQRKKAMHDALTGLPNREAYKERLDHEMNRMQRYGGKLSMMVCDIDFFKRINDNYGHLAGDRVLKIIAKALQRNLRDTDFIARFGGEEFVALMPETDSEHARQVAEKLRQKIESSPFNFKREPVQITMSVGISEFAANEDPEVVFDRADKALYKAKESGRNQVQLG